jgi:hypothetical protein
MPDYYARTDSNGEHCIFNKNNARHSIHDTLSKAQAGASALNKGGEKEYQKDEWDPRE